MAKKIKIWVKHLFIKTCFTQILFFLPIFYFFYPNTFFVMPNMKTVSVFGVL